MDLRVRVTSAQQGLGRSIWTVFLRTPAGATVRETLGLAGDRLSFKGLDPGNYVVCVSGDKGRRRCQSVDLTPPAGSSRHRFEFELELPSSPVRQADLFVVSRYRLAVPPKAREEMDLARRAAARGNSEESLGHMKRALEISPDYPDALNALGAYYYARRKHGAAIEMFTRVTEIDPQFHGGWLNLGASFTAVGRFGEALDAHLRAYALNPSDPDVLSSLGLDCYLMRRYGEAKAYFRQLLRVDPAHIIGPQLYLAAVAVIEEKRAEAVECLQGYLSLHPNSPKAARVRKWMEKLTAPVPLDANALITGP